MDSYEILNVTRDSSDKEIEISYEDLKKKYDPNFNTSIRAYNKYREILKAYENIKNDRRRKMYDLKDDEIVEDKEIKTYELFDYKREEDTFIDPVIEDNLEEIKDVVREDIIVNKSVSYLYYLLNLKIDLTYKRRVICGECLSYETCSECKGQGVVYYKEKQVYCPKCHGKGKVSSNCHKCGDEGSYLKEENINFFVDNESMIFNNLGEEYYDFTKSNLIVNFDFYDKDNIEVNGNEIIVKYYLNKEETMNGFMKEYYSENSSFKLEVSSFVSDGFEKEIIFNNKKITFIFYNEKIDGDKEVSCLFINKKYDNCPIYFNEDYSDCSVNENSKFFNKVILNKEVTLQNFGKKGMYGGVNGDLVIKCIFNNSDNLKYVNNIEIVETSKMFNVLGGNINGIRHYGFKGSNYLLESNNKNYLLSGESKDKRKLKNYFLFKIVCFIVLLLIPSILLFIPYSASMYITFISVLISYLIAINFVMEVRL